MGGHLKPDFSGSVPPSSPASLPQTCRSWFLSESSPCSRLNPQAMEKSMKRHRARGPSRPRGPFPPPRPLPHPAPPPGHLAQRFLQGLRSSPVFQPTCRYRSFRGAGPVRPLHPMAPVPSGPASACRDLPHSAAAAEGSWTGPRISLASSHCSPTQQPRPQAEPRDGVHAGSGKVYLLQRGCPQVSGPRGQRRARLPCQAIPLTTVSPLTPGQAISAPGWPSSGRCCCWFKVTRRAQVQCP